MPGHAARHGVDGVLDLGALGLQGVRQFFYQVLSLSDGHSVARHDNDLFCPAQDLGGIGGSDFFLRELVGRRGFFLGGPGDAGLAQEDVSQAGVHGPAHYLGEEEAAGPYDSPYGNQEDVADGHAGDGTGHPAKGVEEGNGDGHVGAPHPYRHGNSPKSADQGSGGNDIAHGDPRQKSEDDGQEH